MLKKKCDYCFNNSYSASNLQKWICPYCNRDITYVESENIGSKSEIECNVLEQNDRNERE